MGYACGATGGNTKRDVGDVGDVLGGDGSQRRRFCGETASARQAFTALKACEDSGTDVTEDSRSGNIRMVAVTQRDVALRGLMASCDIFGERSMQYGTYASANS
jgi:hypothetical protein